MGVIRWARNALLFGGALLGATALGVVYMTERMRDAHLDGRSLNGRVDVTVVLGAGIEPDGILTYAARRRVRTGVELLRKGGTEMLLMSGGYPSGGSQSLAASMRDFAISLGASGDQILIEERSRTTWENIRLSVPIINESKTESVAILTDDFHLFRAALLSRYLYREVPLVASDGQNETSLAEQSLVYGRETLAWWFNLLKAGAWAMLRQFGYSEEERAEWIF